jgi:predicted ATP-grasp superfamily ATP-dependent carboligase
MTVIDASTPVLVLKAHHGTLGIARSLGRLGVPVHAMHDHLGHPALGSRYLTSVHPWDFTHAAPERTIERLLEIGRGIARHGTAVLIPTSDDTAGLVADHAEALRKVFLFQENAPALVRALSNKRSLYELAMRHGIPTAETTFPRSPDEARRFAETAAFPVMLKGIDGLLLQSRTGRKMAIVRTPAELMEQYMRLEDPTAPNLMLQEYIPGNDDTIWMFNGYFDGRSECRFGVTGKKLRQFPVHTGATSLGICLENLIVRDLTCRLAQATGYRGILDIGFRYDERDATYKLLDPNPRIGQTFRLFVSREGWDVARFLYLDLTGQGLPTATPVEGRRWLVEDWDLESSLDYQREGLLRFAEWLGSFVGVEEGAWFAWDDWGPFQRMVVGLARRAIERILRRSRTAVATSAQGSPRTPAKVSSGTGSASNRRKKALPDPHRGG